MKRKILLSLLCLVFLAVGVYGGWKLLSTSAEYRESEKSYEQLRQYVVIPQSQPTPTTPALSADPDAQTDPRPEREQARDDTAWPAVDFEALAQINPDIVGWIYLEGTNINYPVVQGPDNQVYMYRLFTGQTNASGSNFMDYRNAPDFSDRNTVIYGHHMNNGAMLANITKFKEQSFYDEHPVALLVTPTANYKLEFFAGYVTHVTADAWQLYFGSDEEFAAWTEKAMDQSTFRSQVEPTGQDRVVTLSTCTYEYSDARYVLLGVLKQYS